VCVEGADLVFENDCGCNDSLVCHLDRAENGTLHVTLSLDSTRPKMCDDCFPMIPARCAMPPMPAPQPGAAWTIEINNQTAFVMPLDAQGLPSDGSCWSTKR